MAGFCSVRARRLVRRWGAGGYYMGVWMRIGRYPVQGALGEPLAKLGGIGPEEETNLHGRSRCRRMRSAAAERARSVVDAVTAIQHRVSSAVAPYAGRR